ncbi:hypothetical protein Tco_0618636 [Tanacetum coccineum]
MNGWILKDDEEEEEEEDPKMEEEDLEMEEEMEEENDDDAEVFAPGSTGRDVDTLHRKVKGLAQQMVDQANTEHLTLKRLSVMDRYLADFDTDLRSEVECEYIGRSNSRVSAGRQRRK